MQLGNDARSGSHVVVRTTHTKVELWGSLPFDWGSNLSLHCSAIDVSIESLDATRSSASRWMASLRVRHALGSQPATSDFLTMARHRPTWVPALAPAGITEIATFPASAAPAARVRFRAPDRIGLLAAVFEAIRLCQLQPTALHIRTHGGFADDEITLETDAGTAPSDARIVELRERMMRA